MDAHHHVWDLDTRDQPWTAGLPALRRSFSLSDLRPHLVANRVQATVIVQTVCVAEETPEMLALANEATEVGGVVGWVDLTAPDVDERLSSLREGPGGNYLVGVRHQVQEEPDPRWLCRDDVRRGLAAVGRAGLAYDFVVRAHQLPAVVETVAALGDVRFVLDHGGKPAIIDGVVTPWSEHIRSLGGAAECFRQTVGPRYRGRPGGLDRRAAPALYRRSHRGIWPGPHHVGVGLAGVPAGGELRRCAEDR